MRMDAFSEASKCQAVEGGDVFQGGFLSPAALDAPLSRLDPALAPGAPHMLIYHFVVDGQPAGALKVTEVDLSPGDIVVFPHGDRIVEQRFRIEPDRSCRAPGESRDTRPFADARRWRRRGDRLCVRVPTCHPLLCRPISRACRPC